MSMRLNAGLLHFPNVTNARNFDTSDLFLWTRSEIFITFFHLLNLILGVVGRGVHRGSVWTGP